MAWRNDYDRDYPSDLWYRGGEGRRFDEERAARQAELRPYYGTTRYGTTGGYGYDYDLRISPQQSPTYGRQADTYAQRWATRHGYDAGFEMNPRTGGGWTREFDRPMSTRFSAGGRHGYDRDLSWEPQTSMRYPRAGRRDWEERRTYRW